MVVDCRFSPAASAHRARTVTEQFGWRNGWEIGPWSRNPPRRGGGEEGIGWCGPEREKQTQIRRRSRSSSSRSRPTRPGRASPWQPQGRRPRPSASACVISEPGRCLRCDGVAALVAAARLDGCRAWTRPGRLGSSAGSCGSVLVCRFSGLQYGRPSNSGNPRSRNCQPPRPGAAGSIARGPYSAHGRASVGRRRTGRVVRVRLRCRRGVPWGLPACLFSRTHRWGVVPLRSYIRQIIGRQSSA